MKNFEYTKLTVNEMLIRLSRYPMEERLGTMFNNSLQFIDNDYDVIKTHNTNGIFPWEMETFILLCIMANNKFTPKTFNSKKGRRERNTILSNIRLEMEVWDNFNNKELAEVLLTSIANLQFPIQNYNFLYSTYRYNYLFNKNKELKLAFVKKYKVEYNKIVPFFFLLFSILKSYEYNPKIINYIFNEYFDICNIFAKDLDELIEDQKILSPNPDVYKYSFKLFTSYPFILYNNYYYLPLPHNLITACTDSLLIRLTSEPTPNDKLRQSFGYLFEKYIYKIIKDSSIYPQITPANKYEKEGKEIDSSDVVFSDEEHIVFVDAKLSQTSTGIKNINIEKIKQQTKQYAEGFEQLYKRMNEYPNIFNPFDFECKKDNMFGLLVVLEDSNIMRQKIYTQVFEKLKIDPDGDVAKHIKSHIFICGICELEKLTFLGKSIIPHLKHRKNNPSDLGSAIVVSEIENKQKEQRSPEIKKYKEFLINSIEPYIKDLTSKGYLPTKKTK